MEVNRSSRNDGDIYIPFEKRTRKESLVYFTSNLSLEGLENIYKIVKENIDGKIVIKLHTGEPNGPNI